MTVRPPKIPYPDFRDMADYLLLLDQDGPTTRNLMAMRGQASHGYSPPAIHEEAWLKAIKAHAEDLHIQELPSLLDVGRYYRSPDLYHDFLWSPEGQWTGFARVPDFKQFDQEVLYRLKMGLGPSGYGRVKPWVMEAREGFVRGLCFRVTVITDDIYQYDPRMGMRYAMSFLDYETQAYFADMVERQL